MENLREVFSKFDEDNDGTVSGKEILDVFQTLGAVFTRQVWSKQMFSFDMESVVVFVVVCLCYCRRSCCNQKGCDVLIIGVVVVCRGRFCCNRKMLWCFNHYRRLFCRCCYWNCPLISHQQCDDVIKSFLGGNISGEIDFEEMIKMFAHRKSNEKVRNRNEGKVIERLVVRKTCCSNSRINKRWIPSYQVTDTNVYIGKLSD